MSGWVERCDSRERDGDRAPPLAQLNTELSAAEPHLVLGPVVHFLAHRIPVSVRFLDLPQLAGSGFVKRPVARRFVELQMSILRHGQLPEMELSTLARAENLGQRRRIRLPIQARETNSPVAPRTTSHSTPDRPRTPNNSDSGVYRTTS